MAFQQPGVSALANWVLSLITDSLFSSEGIEEALKRLHGTKKLAEPSYATTSGLKFGILTASIGQPSVFLFNTYNGIGNTRSGYHVVDNDATAELWEV